MSTLQNTIYAGSSEHGDYRIVDMDYEGRPARVLFSGESAGQSGLALDDDPELLFDYNQRFLEIVESQRPGKVLVIGGGAFTLPTALLNRFAGITVDVVEIDPLLYDLAQKYFQAPTDERLRVFNEDGRSYVERTNDRYDLIILDAFDGYMIPRQLITIEAAQAYKNVMTRGGMIAVNFIASYRSFKTTLAHELFATFKQAFASTQIFPADRGYWMHAEQNLLLVCAETEPNVDYLRSAVVTLAHVPDDAVLRDADATS